MCYLFSREEFSAIASKMTVKIAFKYSLCIIIGQQQASNNHYSL